MTWPAQSLYFNVTESVCCAIKLKLYIEAELT